MRFRGVIYLTAGLLWVGCLFQMVMLVIRWYRGTLSDTPILGSLLTQGTVLDHIAPTLVLLVFSWLLLEIILHALRIRREQQDVERLRHWNPSAREFGQSGTRAGNRANLISQYFGESPAKLSEIMPAVASVDAAKLENVYGLTKAFIWTLPVLGFIGTAWGMTHAIGGFSSALQETTDIRTLTDRLSQFVIPGLANAFAVTILALGASIVAHFCLTVVQSWDVDVLNGLDTATLSILAALPSRSSGSLFGSEEISLLLAHIQNIDRNLTGLPSALGLGAASSTLLEAAKELSASGRVLHASATLPYNIRITRGENR